MVGAMCINAADSSQEVCCPIHAAITSWNKTFHSIAGGKRGRFCRRSVCAVCCVCSVLRRLSLPSAPSCEMVRDGADGERSETTALCDRNVSMKSFNY